MIARKTTERTPHIIRARWKRWAIREAGELRVFDFPEGRLPHARIAPIIRLVVPMPVQRFVRFPEDA